MKIISKFKDYYDYAAGLGNEKDFREKVYLRESAFRAAPNIFADVPTLDHIWGDTAVKSAWWTENQKKYRLDELSKQIGYGCILLCGKAYPFLYVHGHAAISAENKYGGPLLSPYYDAALSAYEKSRQERQEKETKPCAWRTKSVAPETAQEGSHFFKTYFSAREFWSDVSIKRKINMWYVRRFGLDADARNIDGFFAAFAGKDFTQLHITFDCPVMLHLWDGRGCLMNPTLSEFGFMRVMSAETLYQEIEMFFGNVLVKDVMPASYQSDVDKLTAHGFDAKTSFRHPKKGG